MATANASRISVKSRDSSARSIRARRRRQVLDRVKNVKPVSFCCTAEDLDPLTIYNKRKVAFASSLTTIKSVHESPVVKFRTKYIDNTEPSWKKAATKLKEEVARRNALLANASSKGPIEWYVEEEIALARDIYWENRLLRYEEEVQKNVRIGRKKVEAELKELEEAAGPRWYQDFSIDQMRNLFILEDMIRADYKQMITGRTQKTLMNLGVVSTFFKIDPMVIRRMQRSCDFKAIDFLRESYRLLTGNYFEDEGYKKHYDCNERIILSAIAFLTLPETILELHKRLPPVTMPTFPPKHYVIKYVASLKIYPPIQKMSSPYMEKLFMRPDWSTYLNKLQDWRDYCSTIPVPKVILPSQDDLKHTYKEKLRAIEIAPKPIKPTKPIKANHSPASKSSKDTFIKEKGSSKRGEKKVVKHEADLKSHDSDRKIKISEEFDIPRLPDENKVFDFTLSGLSETKPGPVRYKICGKLNPPRENKKSWLGEKDGHFVITGVSDDPPQCPISYEMTGVANVTPTNSDERFFTILKLGDGPKTIYPQGREHLSKKWREWLLNADEEFMEVEKEANKILKSVEATMRLVFPGPTCDNCCPCRQTRKTDIIRKQTKAPYLVIDTLTQDEQNQKYIVGSMALHSPAPTPHESTVNLLEIIASEDRVVPNVVINGVTNEKGQKKYYITGMKNETIHIPSRRVEPPPPLPPKNVPPCSCAIQQMFNLGVTPRLSTDNIPWTKDEGLCFGKKYRPEADPPYSCKASPGDKSCRLNPFLKQVARLERIKREKMKAKADYYSKGKQNLYSIADFKPCGDEHGMSICGGPWGAVHVLSPQELLELEKQRKEILKGPPCGTRPGRAVCGGPFGERIPQPKKAKIKTDDDDEEDEEDEEEEIQVIAPPPPKPKVPRRDKLCHASPESIATAKKLAPKKVSKFIPDPDYPGYDDPWNIFRTAPSVKETDTEYEKSLNLSSPKKRSDTPKNIREIVRKRMGSKASIQSFTKPLKGSKTLNKGDSKRGGLYTKLSENMKKEPRKRAVKSSAGSLGKRTNGSATKRGKNGKTMSDSSPKRKETSPSSERIASRKDNPRREKSSIMGNRFEEERKASPTQRTQSRQRISSPLPKRKGGNPSPEKIISRKKNLGREMSSTLSDRFDEKLNASSKRGTDSRQRMSSLSPKRKVASPSPERITSRKQNVRREKSATTSDRFGKKQNVSPTRKMDSPRRRHSSSPKRRKEGKLVSDKILQKKSSDRSVRKTKSDTQTREKDTEVLKMVREFSKSAISGKRRKRKSSKNGKKRESKKFLKKFRPSETKLTSTVDLGSSYDKKRKKRRQRESLDNQGSFIYKTRPKRHRLSQQINLKRKITKIDSAKSHKMSKSIDIKKLNKSKLLKDTGSIVMSEESKKQEMERLKGMMKSPNTYPEEVEAVTLPPEPRGSCKHEYGTADETEKEQVPDEKSIVEAPQASAKGPCGWRTKSEQELPVKKTLAYLADPDPPLETIPVRPGGRACICRENRNKKKILMYQIGGSLPKKKAEPDKLRKISVRRKEREDEDQTDTRLIDGIIYYTPPPSRRRSDEYVPEYDLYVSPYEMCADKRKDSFMNILEKYTAPRDVMERIPKTVAPCDCSGYMDTFGVVGEHADIEEAKRLLEERERLMDSKAPKERWELAIKDRGLMDYYAGCKHKIPCWSTCKKFEKYACSLQPRRLKQKKPVCECKYERKIVEKKEEKEKWTERRQKLRTYKKQAFVNVADTSRPMEADTKLIISGVKRIPREDEYIDDVQYFISGVSENYTMGPATRVVAGLDMSTPFQTPQPSKEKIPCVCLHGHWSQSNIPPGPIPTEDEELIKENKRRAKYLEEAAKQIYGPHEPDEEEAQRWYRSCEANCEPVKVRHARRKKGAKAMKEKSGRQSSSTLRSISHKSIDDQSSTQMISVKRTSKNLKKRSVTGEKDSSKQPKTVLKQKNIPKEIDVETQKQDVSALTKIPRKQKDQMNLLDRQDEQTRQDSPDRQDRHIHIEQQDQKTKKSDGSGARLEDMVKSELKKMAEEGFLFAKLPKCHRMPQLRNWIMYRKGFVLTDELTDKFMRLSLMIWGTAAMATPPKIHTPTLAKSEKEIRQLTFDSAHKMKKKIAMKNTIFYSQLRKSRVLYGRSMWTTMEFRKYPSISFKQAYFAYMSSKEADGHVFKPWTISEVREAE